MKYNKKITKIERFLSYSTIFMLFLCGITGYFKLSVYLTGKEPGLISFSLTSLFMLMLAELLVKKYVIVKHIMKREKKVQ